MKVNKITPYIKMLLEIKLIKYMQSWENHIFKSLEEELIFHITNRKFTNGIIKANTSSLILHATFPFCFPIQHS